MSEVKKSDLLLLAEILTRAIRSAERANQLAGRAANDAAYVRRQLKERDDVIRARDALVDEHLRFQRGLEAHLETLRKMRTTTAKTKAFEALRAFIDEFVTRCPF